MRERLPKQIDGIESWEDRLDGASKDDMVWMAQAAQHDGADSGDIRRKLAEYGVPVDLRARQQADPPQQTPKPEE